MGSGSSQQQSGTSLPIINPLMRQLLRQSTQADIGGLNAANAAGGLPGLLQPHPQQIAGLTGGQIQDIGQLQQWGMSGTPQEQQAQSLLSGLTGGDIGSSPATAAAMRAYSQNVAPTIASGLAASGGGRGGEMAAALQQGQTSAYVPLVQQEIANREAGIGQAAGLGQQRSQDVQNAITGQQMIQQNQQQQFDAQYQDYLRRSGLIQQLTQGPMQQFGGAAMGQRTSGSAGGTQGPKL